MFLCTASMCLFKPPFCEADKCSCRGISTAWRLPLSHSVLLTSSTSMRQDEKASSKRRPRYKRRLRRRTRKTVKYVLGICPTGGRAPRVEEAPTHSVNLLLGLDGADPTEGRRALVDLLPGLGQQVPTLVNLALLDASTTHFLLSVKTSYYMSIFYKVTISKRNRGKSDLMTGVSLHPGLAVPITEGDFVTKSSIDIRSI